VNIPASGMSLFSAGERSGGQGRQGGYLTRGSVRRLYEKKAKRSSLYQRRGEGGVPLGNGGAVKSGRKGRVLHIVRERQPTEWEIEIRH